MELTSIKPIDRAEVNITHPVTGEKTDIFFTVCGLDSKEYRQSLRDLMVSRLANSEGELSSAELERDEINLIANCTKGFRGFTIEGKEPDFNKETLTEIYSDYPFIKEQLDKFIANRSNFFLKASKNTTPTSSN